MSLQLPTPRLSELPGSKKRRVPIEQILQVLGNNPIAKGIDVASASISDALANRAERQRQARAVATLASASGDTPPSADSGLTPETYEKLLGIRNSKDEKKANAAKQRTSLEMELEKLRSGYTETDPTTGVTRKYPGVKDFNIDYDEDGNPTVRRGPAYAPREVPKSLGGGMSARGQTQQSQFSDSTGTPLIFNRDKPGNKYTRPDGSPAIGAIVPIKGNAEAVQGASRAAVLLPHVDTLEKRLDEKSDLGRRASLAPILGPIFDPETTQLINEAKQAGFSFGGKNYTGNEEKIIKGAMIPGSLDSAESSKTKLKVLRQYMAGSVDLLQAANLLGAAGGKIKEIIASGGGDLSRLPIMESPSERKARLIKEAQGQ